MSLHKRSSYAPGSSRGPDESLNKQGAVNTLFANGGVHRFEELSVRPAGDHLVPIGTRDAAAFSSMESPLVRRTAEWHPFARGAHFANSNDSPVFASLGGNTADEGWAFAGIVATNHGFQGGPPDARSVAQDPQMVAHVAGLVSIYQHSPNTFFQAGKLCVLGPPLVVNGPGGGLVSGSRFAHWRNPAVVDSPDDFFPPELLCMANDTVTGQFLKIEMLFFQVVATDVGVDDRQFYLGGQRSDGFRLGERIIPALEDAIAKREADTGERLSDPLRRYVYYLAACHGATNDRWAPTIYRAADDRGRVEAAVAQYRAALPRAGAFDSAASAAVANDRAVLADLSRVYARSAVQRPVDAGRVVGEVDVSEINPRKSHLGHAALFQMMQEQQAIMNARVVGVVQSNSSPAATFVDVLLSGSRY